MEGLTKQKNSTDLMGNALDGLVGGVFLNLLTIPNTNVIDNNVIFVSIFIRTF